MKKKRKTALKLPLKIGEITELKKSKSTSVKSKKRILKSLEVAKNSKKPTSKPSKTTTKRKPRTTTTKSSIPPKKKAVKKTKIVEKLTPKVELPPPVFVTPKLPKRKRRPRTPSNKMYFTQETENAIVEFNSETCPEKREQIYKERIEFAFKKLVENIYNTFKFSYFETGPLDVQQEALSHLVANIEKYKKSKGKAFSYFSIIAKHYLILLNNTNYKKFQQTVEIGEDSDENTIQLQHIDRHHEETEMKEFIKLMIEFWDNNIPKIFNKQRDINIANAVVELFRRSDTIELFNKKALYLNIREISACKTQQITKVINKMKQYQKNIYRTYIENGTVNTKSLMRI